MKFNPADWKLDLQVEVSDAAPKFDRERIPASVAWMFGGLLTLAAVLWWLMATNAAGGWILVVPWLVGGGMLWGGIFMPFRIGWIGVIIGLAIHGLIAACAPAIGYSMMSH